jgi:ketosteroid isomerase-like protein
MTTSSAMSRRYLLAASAGSLAMACGGATRAPAASSSGAAPPAGLRQELIRSYYDAWRRQDWGSVDALTADDFTFSSAAGDDHINKSTYKAQCWDTQNGRIDRFVLESVLDDGKEAFVKYVCWTKQGKTFRNVEHFTFEGDRIAAIECYFGDAAGYPSAADKAR